MQVQPECLVDRIATYGTCIVEFFVVTILVLLDLSSSGQHYREAAVTLWTELQSVRFYGPVGTVKSCRFASKWVSDK